MSFTSELNTLYRIIAAPVRGATHAERLESFYSGQAAGYDDFRRRLLHGRQALYEALPTPQGGHWVEMGGGTGANLEYLGDRIHQLGRVTLVDLSPSLVAQAKQRATANEWQQFETRVEDVTQVELEPADVITFSYSLTMIPNWFTAVDHALQLLKPGGILGVVDFYVSRKFASTGHEQHGWLTRNLWPVWFGSDNVHPSADHLEYLLARTACRRLVEARGKVPYLPLVRAPYYQFIGQKR